MSETAAIFSVTLYFTPALSFFLAKEKHHQPVTRGLCEKTSIKDAVEACGVPHPEIDFLLCDGVSVGFEHQIAQDAIVQVYGTADPAPLAGEKLQQRRVTNFVADGHLGKLARDLRFLGFDVTYLRDAKDGTLVAMGREGARALLTRDRRLLMHKEVRHGYCPRSSDAQEQIIDVIRRFDLAGLFKPYTRCMQCNGRLRRVAKSDVLEQLEPLTRIYYDDFRKCSECGKIYWPGSHFGKLEARLGRIRDRLHSEDRQPGRISGSK